MEHGTDATKQPKFHDKLKKKIDEFVHATYRATRKFPREELFGATSQLRRAALSVMLNYIEGYARLRPKVYGNFLEIAFGSLQESRYLLDFSCKEGYLSENDFKKIDVLADEIGAMLWTTLRNVDR